MYPFIVDIIVIVFNSMVVRRNRKNLQSEQKPYYPTKLKIIYHGVVYLAIGLLAGFVIAFLVYSLSFPGYGDGRYYPPGCCQGPVSFKSNGERVYYTDINDRG